MSTISTHLYLIQGTPPARQLIDRQKLSTDIFNELPPDTPHEINVIPSPSQPPGTVSKYLYGPVSNALRSQSYNAMAIINVDGLESDVVDNFVAEQVEATEGDRFDGNYLPKVILFENEGTLEWDDRFREPVNLGVLEVASNNEELVTNIVRLLKQIEGENYGDDYNDRDKNGFDDDDIE